MIILVGFGVVLFSIMFDGFLYNLDGSLIETKMISNNPSVNIYLLPSFPALTSIFCVLACKEEEYHPLHWQSDSIAFFGFML